MSNAEYSEKLNEIIKNDAEATAGRRAAFVSTVCLVSGRAFLFIAETLLALTNNYPFPVFTVVMVVVSALFGLFICGGSRPLAGLVILGGFLSAFSALREGTMFALFEYGPLLAKIYVIAFVIAVISTIVPMAYLLLNSKYRKYSNLIIGTRKTLMTKRTNTNNNEND